jgi:hypothetical protein
MKAAADGNLALGAARLLGQFVRLGPADPALVREEQQGVVGGDRTHADHSGG